MKTQIMPISSTVLKEQTRDWNEDTHWPGQVSDYEFDLNNNQLQSPDRRNYRRNAPSKGRRGLLVDMKITISNSKK